MSENKQSANNDKALAMLGLLIVFMLLVITAIMSSSHPLDFIVNALGMITGYIFLILFICILAGIFIYYWKIASPDPEQTLSEATRDNLEYTKEVTSDLSEKAREFYADYKERVKAAEEEQKKKQAQEKKS